MSEFQNRLKQEERKIRNGGPLRIVIAGQKYFGMRVFDLLNSRRDAEVVAVHAPDPSDKLYRKAMESGVPVINSTKGIGSRVTYDIGITAHHFGMITREERGRSAFGWIGYHPSLLPRHRGNDSIRWACDANDIITGGTVYQLSDEWDTGEILAQDWCWLGKDRDPAQVWRDELLPMGLRLLDETITKFIEGSVTRKVQDERFATYRFYNQIVRNSEAMDILSEYTDYLLKEGYVDADIYAEGFSIDGFIRQRAKAAKTGH